MASIARREFLAGSILAAGDALLAPRIAFARTAGETRLVLVILRGALDGLTAMPPYADADYVRLRQGLALAGPGGPQGVLRLDALFGLHPSLTFLHESFAAHELVAFHAVASPYRERSHFDGQDLLENGTVRPHAVETGWMNRALAALPQQGASGSRELGVALGQNVPLVMRGPAPVASWSPSRLAALDDETLQRITDLYAGDAILSRRLADALAADAIAGAGMEPPQPGGTDGQEMAPASGQDSGRKEVRPGAGGAARYQEIVRAAGGFLAREEGPRVAVFDTTGWDTHANEGGAQGQLAQRLAALDTGLRALSAQLGPAWRRTAVLLVTEFGRTAAANGTRGTDHGTATCAFLVGGAVSGGRVIADWPGLGDRALYQGRDLAPTLDLRSILKGVLMEHLAVPAGALEEAVFPESVAARPLMGLMRT
jgi:uncharacterized protein (DUF1501 family)